MHIRLSILIQIVNVFYLQFQIQTFESNTFARAFVKSVVFVGAAETEPTDYTNRHVVKGYQEARWTIPIAKICQGVLAYPVLSEMKTYGIFAYCIRRSAYLSVRMNASFVDKTRERLR